MVQLAGSAHTVPFWQTEEIFLWLNAYYSCSFLITICSLYWFLIEQLGFYILGVVFSVLYHADLLLPVSVK